MPVAHKSAGKPLGLLAGAITLIIAIAQLWAVFCLLLWLLGFTTACYRPGLYCHASHRASDARAATAAVSAAASAAALASLAGIPLALLLTLGQSPFAAVAYAVLLAGSSWRQVWARNLAIDAGLGVSVRDAPLFSIAVPGEGAPTARAFVNALNDILGSPGIKKAPFLLLAAGLLLVPATAGAAGLDPIEKAQGLKSAWPWINDVPSGPRSGTMTTATPSVQPTDEPAVTSGLKLDTRDVTPFGVVCPGSTIWPGDGAPSSWPATGPREVLLALYFGPRYAPNSGVAVGAGADTVGCPETARHVADSFDDEYIQIGRTTPAGSWPAGELVGIVVAPLHHPPVVFRNDIADRVSELIASGRAVAGSSRIPIGSGDFQTVEDRDGLRVFVRRTLFNGDGTVARHVELRQAELELWRKSMALKAKWLWPVRTGSALELRTIGVGRAARLVGHIDLRKVGQELDVDGQAFALRGQLPRMDIREILQFAPSP